MVNYNEDSISSSFTEYEVNRTKNDKTKNKVEQLATTNRKYKTVIKKGNWSKEEDEKIIELVKQHGEKEWKCISMQIENRTSKQCRERWVNQLRPNISKNEWSEEENIIIFILHKQHGNKWSLISKSIPNRTDNSIKNHWNNYLRHKKSMIKKLIKGKYAEYGISVDGNLEKENQLVTLINWGLENDAITKAKCPQISLPESGSSFGLKLILRKVESPPQVKEINSKHLNSTQHNTESQNKHLYEVLLKCILIT